MIIEISQHIIQPIIEISGKTGPGLPPGTLVEQVGDYLQWTIEGQTYHTRILQGPAPIPDP